MRSFTLRSAVGCQVVVLVGILTVPVRGDVENVSGNATASIVQFFGDFPVQTDFSTENVPLTTPTPPAVARARLDHLLPDGGVGAGAQIVSLLAAPNLSGVGPPNDVGLDLGAFSDDPLTRWSLEGEVTETRTIRLVPRDFAGELGRGARTRVRSRIVLSGVILITALEAAQDLSGVAANLDLRVVQGGLHGDVPPLLEGEVSLVGGPGGAIDVGVATGVFSGMPLPILDFVGQLESLPLAKAMVFVGLVIPYDYDIVVGEPFELTLIVSSQITTAPGGTGAAVVLGLPQQGLGSVLARVKGDDRGHRLSELVSQHVDTTGQSYGADELSAAPLPGMFPMCGVMGLESAGLMLACLMLTLTQVRRRRV